MAVTENTYTGNGSTTNYSFTFPYLETSDIKVTLNGTLTTAYTLANATTVSFNTAPSNGVAIRIYRQTDDTTAKAVFYPGSAIRAQDLNDNFNQVLYSTQETVARRVDSTGGSMTGNLEFSAGKGIVFEGATDDAHETTLLGGNPTADRTLNLPNVSGTLVSTGDTGTVATAMIADSNVTTAKIADSNVTTAKIADANITTAKLADGSVTSAKIADGTIVADDIASSAVTTAKILDSNVTTAKIADSNVTTAKLADGAVTSAKIADGTIVAGDIATDAVITSKILDQNVTTAKIADQNVTTAKIADLNVTTGKINDQAVTAAKIADGVIDSTKLTGATVVTNAEHTGSTPNDTSFFTTSASDSRYFRQDSSETITSGNPWSSSDTYVATTAAIDARVIDLVDDVGGFVPITNETSFPLTNPDINNPDGSGTIISIKEIVTTRTPASGTVTIANGAGSNTVTINGCGSTVLASGFGVLVETTSTLHTYNFHRLVPKATEVTTVAGISGDITTVATNNANVTAVAGNAANINTVAGNNANVTAVATNSTNINAVAGNATNINAVAGNAANINTVSTNIANVNNVGGSIANVNSVASNLGTVNDFAARYRVASSDPVTSLDTGDLVFNTTSSELRVYNGTSWQGGVTATGNLVSKSGDTMTGPLGVTAGTAALPSLFISGDPNTGIYSPGADQVAISTGGSGRLFVDASGNVGFGTSSTTGYWPSNLTQAAARASVVYNDSSTDLNSANAGLVILNSNSTASTSSKLVFGANNTDPVPVALAYISAVNANRTGAYLASSLIFGTGGGGSVGPAERMRLDSSGRLGVGTSSPGAKLDVVDSSATKAYFKHSTSNQTSLYIESDDSSARIGSTYHAGGGSFKPLAFLTSGSERLTITAAGNVGIGTSSVTGNLHVKGDDGINIGRADGGNQWRFIPNNGATGSTNLRLYEGVSGTEVLNITTGGRLGIGTSSPSVNLDVAGSEIRVKNTSGSAGLTVSRSSNSSGAVINLNTGDTNKWFFGLRGLIDDKFYFYNNVAGNTALTIDESSRVGIGTTPTSIFHVKAATNRNFKIDSAGGGGGDLRISALNDADSANVNLQLQGDQLFFAAGGAERARIDSSGRFLVGTTSSVDSALIQFAGAKTYTSGIPQNQLNVNDTTSYATGVGGVISFSGKYHSAGFNTTFGSIEGVKLNATDGDYSGALVFRTRTNGGNNDERMRITSAGNVGIGTTSPGSALSLGGSNQSTTDRANSIRLYDVGGTNGNNYGFGFDGSVGGFYYTAGTGGFHAWLTANTERLRIANDGSISSVIPGGSTLYPRFGCRAWVNFNGQGAVAIRANGNVSSITDNGVGDYTVNFTTAMPDANYCAIATPSGHYGTNDGGQTGMNTTAAATEAAPATNATRFVFNNYSADNFDPKYVNFAVFR